MSKVHGRKAFFSLTDIGGSVRNLSGWFNNIDFPTQVDNAETTGFNDSEKTYVVGLKGRTIKGAGQWDGVANGPDDVLSNLEGQGSEGTVVTSFVFGPAGSATGNVKYSGSLVITNYGITAPIGGAVMFNMDALVTGAVTRGTF